MSDVVTLELERESERFDAVEQPVGSDLSETVEDSICQDRRILRTRRALREAIIALIEERGLDGFTVNDLCAEADLNRGTFYNHFASKDALLGALEDEIMEDLKLYQQMMQEITLSDLLRYKVTRKPFPFLVKLFDYLREQGDFVHAVLGSGGDSRFSERLKNSVCTDLIQSVLHERYRNSPTPFVNYYVAFYASAYLGVIVAWLQGGMQESSQDMARIAMRLFLIQPGESIEL